MVQEFSEAQAAVARALAAGPKTLEKLRQETKFSALDVNEALRGLLKLGLVERAGDDYRLVSYIAEKVRAVKSEGLRKLEQAGSFKANLVIEAAGDSAEMVREQLRLLEEQLLKEPYKILRAEKSSVQKLEGQYSQFLDVDVQASSFHDLVYLIITYGPSSVELLEPVDVRLNLREAQDVLTSVLNAVHYYTGFILQSQLELRDLQAGKRPAARPEKPAESGEPPEAGAQSP